MLKAGEHIVVDAEHLKAIEDSVRELSALVKANAVNQSVLIGDWIPESEVIRLTQLGRTTLYKMRKEGILSTSSLVDGKGRFYRLSEIEELLYARQEIKK